VFRNPVLNSVNVANVRSSHGEVRVETCNCGVACIGTVLKASFLEINMTNELAWSCMWRENDICLTHPYKIRKVE
jgi:hypothetical protein